MNAGYLTLAQQWLMLPTALVQVKGHCVEIDNIGTRLVCNKGTCPTLHMSYDKDNELWYLIGSHIKVPAKLNVVTQSKTTTACNQENTAQADGYK
jgi:hypothetical protein